MRLISRAASPRASRSKIAMAWSNRHTAATKRSVSASRIGPPQSSCDSTGASGSVGSSRFEYRRSPQKSATKSARVSATSARGDSAPGSGTSASVVSRDPESRYPATRGSSSPTAKMRPSESAATAIGDFGAEERASTFASRPKTTISESPRVTAAKSTASSGAVPRGIAAMAYGFAPNARLEGGRVRKSVRARSAISSLRSVSSASFASGCTGTAPSAVGTGRARSRVASCSFGRVQAMAPIDATAASNPKQDDRRSIGPSMACVRTTFYASSSCLGPRGGLRAARAAPSKSVPLIGYRREFLPGTSVPSLSR